MIALWAIPSNPNEADDIDIQDGEINSFPRQKLRAYQRKAVFLCSHFALQFTTLYELSKLRNEGWGRQKEEKSRQKCPPTTFYCSYAATLKLIIMVRWPCHEQLLFCQFLGHLACFLSYHHTRLIVLFICLYETGSFFQTRSLFVFVLLEHVPCYSCIFFHSPEVSIVISPFSAVFFIAEILANFVIFTWSSGWLSEYLT